MPKEFGSPGWAGGGSDDMMKGAELYLKMAGVKEAGERTRIAQQAMQTQVQQAQMQMMGQVKAMQDKQAFDEDVNPLVMANSMNQEGFHGPWQPGMNIPDIKTLTERMLPHAIEHNQMPFMKEAFDFVKETNPAPKGFEAGQPVWSNGQWTTAPGTPKSKDTVPNEIIAFEMYSGLKPEQRGTPEYQEAYNKFKGIGKTGSIPSAGNAVDLAIKRKYGSDYLKDPEKGAIADLWLSTTEGREAVKQARDDLTSPTYTFQATDQGIVPVITKGTGAGTIGEPTGLKKPLSDAQLAKVGELNTVITNIEKTKILYGYGTEKEKEEWVGPLKGRVGSFEEKFLGTASSDQVKFYAYVKDMEDALLRARSGAQINETEYQRLKNFLPDPNLPPVTFKARLERFEEATKIVMNEKLSAFEKGGLGVGGLNKQSSANDLELSSDEEIYAINELEKRGVKAKDEIANEIIKKRGKK